MGASPRIPELGDRSRPPVGRERVARYIVADCDNPDLPGWYAYEEAPGFRCDYCARISTDDETCPGCGAPR